MHAFQVHVLNETPEPIKYYDCSGENRTLREQLQQANAFRDMFASSQLELKQVKDECARLNDVIKEMEAQLGKRPAYAGQKKIPSDENPLYKAPLKIKPKPAPQMMRANPVPTVPAAPTVPVETPQNSSLIDLLTDIFSPGTNASYNPEPEPAPQQE